MNQCYVLFVGTGTSEGVPRVSCLTKEPSDCPICLSSIEPGSRNRRRNTSILIRIPSEKLGRHFNILIDCGKFFYHSAIEWFPKYKIRNIDAIILTHYHSDSANGLDDLRDWTANVNDGNAIPIYCSSVDYEVLSRAFPYLTNTDKATGSGFVSSLHWNIIDIKEPFYINDIQFIPLDVEHGFGIRCLGFRFGNIVYISDCSKIPQDTFNLMKNSEDDILDIFIIDCLSHCREHPSHLWVPEVISTIFQLNPKKSYFTGMDHSYDNDKSNDLLKKLFTTQDIQMPHDGLYIPISLNYQQQQEENKSIVQDT